MAFADYYKNNPEDVIWWKETPDTKGDWVFSFDREKDFNLFRDYPERLTDAQKAIFDRENPQWAQFFKGRQ